MAKGIMRSTKTRDGIAAALAYNLGDLEEDQYQVRQEWLAQHAAFADMQDALEQAGLRVLNRPNLTDMGRKFWTTRDMPTSAVVANTYTIPIEDATAAAETLTYTITDEAITSSFSIFQKISSDSTNVPSSLVTATFAAGVATVTIAARSAHSAAVTIKLWLCTSASATVPYGSATRISGTSYPYLKSIQQGAYPGDDSADGIVCSVITLTGTDIITETDGEIFDRALQFNISANSAYGNTEWLLSGYPYPTTKYGNGQIPKNYGQITELTPGERYTIAFRARVISGEKAIARFGFGGGFYSNSPNSNPADGRTGLSDWIEISGSEWKWYSWTFDYNPTGDWYTEAQTTENNLTYTIRTYAYAKKIGFGIGRKYNAVIQLAAFRCVQGRLYITDTYDDLEEAVTALRGRATALETASDEVPGAISAAKAAVLGIVAESDTATATANHAVGDLFVMGDVLYKTTAAIATGETITPGTNCSATTLAAEIEAAAASTPDLSAYAPKASPAFTGSISMGRQTETTVGLRSVAVGNNATATGNYSGAIGNYTVAGGNGAVAVGNKSEASGNNSFASGEQTIANHRSQVAFGEYNVQDPNTTYTGRGTYAEIVGNGTSNSARSNARTLDWNGNEWLAGTLTLGNTTLTEAQLQALLSLVSGGLNGTTWVINNAPTAPAQTITVTNNSGLFYFVDHAYNPQYSMIIDTYHDEARIRYVDQYGDSSAYVDLQWADAAYKTITFTADIDTASPSVQAFLDWLHANATQQ